MNPESSTNPDWLAGYGNSEASWSRRVGMAGGIARASTKPALAQPYNILLINKLLTITAFQIND